MNTTDSPNRHIRHISYCDHCGMPSVYHNIRSIDLHTPYENGQFFSECRQCNSLPGNLVFAQDIPLEQRIKNRSFTDDCTQAIEHIYAIGDELNKQGHHNSQPDWRRVWTVMSKVPTNLTMVIQICAQQLGVHKEVKLVLLHEHHGKLHQVDMKFIDQSIAEVGAAISPYIKIAPTCRVFLDKLTVDGQFGYAKCNICDMAKHRSDYPSLIGNEASLDYWRPSFATDAIDFRTLANELNL